MSVDSNPSPRHGPATSPVHPRRPVHRVAADTLGVVAALAGIGWLGLRTEPQPLPDAGLEAGPVTTIPVPDGLPEPVDRFYRTLYGEEIPVVETALVSGRGQLRVNGIAFPVRYLATGTLWGNEALHWDELDERPSCR